MVKRILRVKAKSLREQVNLGRGGKYYFGTSSRMPISIYFTNKVKMFKFLAFAKKQQRKKSPFGERKKLIAFVLVK